MGEVVEKHVSSASAGKAIGVHLGDDDPFERAQRLLDVGFEEMARVMEGMFLDEETRQNILDIKVKLRSKLHNAVVILRQSLKEGASERVVALARHSLMQALSTEMALAGELLIAAENRALAPASETKRKSLQKHVSIEVPPWAFKAARSLAQEARRSAPQRAFSEGDIAAAAIRFVSYHQEAFLASPLIQPRSDFYFQSFEVQPKGINGHGPSKPSRAKADGK